MFFVLHAVASTFVQMASNELVAQSWIGVTQDGVQKGSHLEVARCIAADTPVDWRGYTPESVAKKVNINACADCFGLSPERV